MNAWQISAMESVRKAMEVPSPSAVIESVGNRLRMMCVGKDEASDKVRGDGDQRDEKALIGDGEAHAARKHTLFREFGAARAS